MGDTNVSCLSFLSFYSFSNRNTRNMTILAILQLKKGYSGLNEQRLKKFLSVKKDYQIFKVTLLKFRRKRYIYNLFIVVNFKSLWQFIVVVKLKNVICDIINPEFCSRKSPYQSLNENNLFSQIKYYQLINIIQQYIKLQYKSTIHKATLN